MTINEHLAALAAIVDAKPWGAAQFKPRLYLRSRKDITLFISFEDACYTSPDEEVTAIFCLAGCKLHCFIDECGQSPKWYASQRRIAMENARPAFDAVMWALHTDNLAEAEEIFENEIEITDEIANHLINGRIDEARALLHA